MVVRRVNPQTVPDWPYIGLEHIGMGSLHTIGATRCSEVTSPAQVAEPGDVLFGKLRPYFRKVVRAPFRVVCSGELWVLGARSGMDQGFLFYVAANPLFVDACSSSSTGTHMPRADWSYVAALPVLVPPLGEQRRIAALLGALDSKVDLFHRMNKTLEELANAMFRSWFIDFVGHEDKVESEIGRIPRGWSVGGINTVAVNIRDTVDPNTLPGETPYVGLEHVPRHTVALNAWGRVSDVGSTKTRFCLGDTLFGKLRPYFHKVVPAPVDGVASTDILVIRPRNEDWRWFAFGHLYSDAMVAHATAAADGTKMPRANWKDICRFPLVIPPRERVAEYGRVVGPLYARISANVQESRTLSTLRDTLLPKLLSGEIRVPEAEDAVEEVL